MLLRLVYWLSHRGSRGIRSFRPWRDRRCRHRLLLATPVVAYLALLVQISLRGGVGSAIESLATGILFVTGAWIAWRLAHLVAEAITLSARRGETV